MNLATESLTITHTHIGEKMKLLRKVVVKFIALQAARARARIRNWKHGGYWA